MGTRIKIMDLELDILTEETLRQELENYLSNDYLNVIHLISLDYIDTYDQNELVRETLGEADLVLPGEKAILSSYHVDVLETGGMVVDYHTAGRQLKSVLGTGKKCYLILKNRKEAKIIYRYIALHCPDMEIAGLYTADGTATGEALVNDINTKLPDIIFMSLESTEGEEWIHSNKLKINAKLCILLSSVTNMLIRDNIHVPRIFKALHLGQVYTCIAGIPYSNSWRRRIFQKKMDNYNNKKLLEKADVMEELPDDRENKEP